MHITKYVFIIKASNEMSRVYDYGKVKNKAKTLNSFFQISCPYFIYQILLEKFVKLFHLSKLETLSSVQIFSEIF